MKKSEDDIRKEYFSDLTRWQSWLDVESALALVPVSYTHLTLPTTPYV